MISTIAQQVLLVILGAALSLAGVLVKSSLDRTGTISDRLFEERLKALSVIWKKLNEVRRAFNPKIALGHPRWKELYSDESRDKLEAFRSEFEDAAIILDAQVIDGLRELDLYFFGILDEDDQKPGKYAAEVEKGLIKLQRTVQKNLRRKWHRVSLVGGREGGKPVP